MLYPFVLLNNNNNKLHVVERRRSVSATLLGKGVFFKKTFSVVYFLQTNSNIKALYSGQKLNVKQTKTNSLASKDRKYKQTSRLTETRNADDQ